MLEEAEVWDCGACGAHARSPGHTYHKANGLAHSALPLASFQDGRSQCWSVSNWQFLGLPFAPRS